MSHPTIIASFGNRCILATVEDWKAKTAQDGRKERCTEGREEGWADSLCGHY